MRKIWLTYLRVYHAVTVVAGIVGGALGGSLASATFARWAGLPGVDLFGFLGLVLGGVGGGCLMAWIARIAYHLDVGKRL